MSDRWTEGTLAFWAMETEERWGAKVALSFLADSGRRTQAMKREGRREVVVS